VKTVPPKRKTISTFSIAVPRRNVHYLDHSTLHALGNPKSCPRDRSFTQGNKRRSRWFHISRRRSYFLPLGSKEGDPRFYPFRFERLCSRNLMRQNLFYRSSSTATNLAARAGWGGARVARAARKGILRCCFSLPRTACRVYRAKPWSMSAAMTLTQRLLSTQKYSVITWSVGKLARPIPPSPF